MKEEVGIAIKSKETSSDVSSQLEPVRNCNYNAQAITGSSNTCSQMHEQIKHSLAYLQEFSPRFG